MAGGLGLLESIGVMIVTACAIVLLARRAAIPSIVLYILAGLLLGPILGVFHFELADSGPDEDHDPVSVIAEIGIALLLFLVGLELSLDRIRDVGKVAVYAGTGQVVFTAAGGFLLSMLLQFTVMESIFLATALTFSSTVVVVKLLDQKKEIHSLYGRIAVGIFLVQDLVVIVVLTFLAGLGDGEERNLLTMSAGVAQAFLGMGLLLAVALVASRYLLPRPFRWAARSPETLFIWSLCLCFLFVLLAVGMSLSPEIGAFLAGLSLAQLDCASDLRRRVHPLMNFFIAVFFVSLGAQMELEAARDYWRSGLVLSLFVLLGNPFIFMWIITASGYSEKTSFLTSVTVAQISEFSFIFAAVGLSTGLIDEGILSLIAVVGLVTIAASSYMIIYNYQLYDWCRRMGLLRMFRAKADLEEDGKGAPPLRDHVAIIGMNALGRRLAGMLSEMGEQVLAIDTDIHKLEGLPAKRLVGNVDYLSVVEEAGLEHAKLVISTLQIEDTNNLLAYRCKQMGVPVAIHAFDRSVLPDLRRLSVDFHIDSRSAGFRRLTQLLQEEGFVSS